MGGPNGQMGGPMSGPMGPMGGPNMMQGYQGWGNTQAQGYPGQWGPTSNQPPVNGRIYCACTTRFMEMVSLSKHSNLTAL